MVNLSAGLLSVLGSPGVLARGTLAMFRFDEMQRLTTMFNKPVVSDRMKAEIPYS